jgi:protein-L-isoaspartate(D-aspartate) O-methyltransferase
MGFMKQLPQSDTMRRNMVDSQLRTSGVNTPWVIAAMLATPREIFVSGDVASAYMDRAIALGGGRMLNPPVAAALMAQLSDARPDDKVLLVGGGTGYLAALLASQVQMLVVVEEDSVLAQSFRSNLPDVTLVEAPLAAGAAAHAPYDLIVIDGGIEQLPDSLVDQLAEGGRVVTGLIEGPVSRLATGVKRGPHLALRAAADTEIAPLAGFARAKAFVF